MPSLIQPIATGESTLSVTRNDLRSAVARIMGWDRSAEDWEGDQIGDGAAMVAAAERRVYGAHQWSFLTPTREATLVVGEATYDLPEDFASMEGPIYYSGDWSGYAPITQSSMSVIWTRRRQIVSVGLPTYYAWEPIAQDGVTSGQRYALQFDIAPASAFTIRLRYRISPYAMSDTQSYPLGGERFAEVLRYAAISQAEIEWKGGAGPQTDHFNQLLAEAIAEDIRIGPKFLGRNLDYKRYPSLPWMQHRQTGVPLYYNGQSVF